MALGYADSSVSAYREVGRRSEIAGASPHRLVQMLFDGALGNLEKARLAMEENDIEARGRAINLAVDILVELRVSLNHEKGGEISTNLDLLYQHMQGRLMEIHRHGGPEKLREVVALLAGLSESWAAIKDQVK
ncbi:flagellar export chaperone FliS [Chromatiales bacterium (ex Bugula neritina AB1)]|nr:flagellar export chaperone FliS [Chromatiales bacterium (ex Bugula neritina AB1)]